VSRPSVSQDVNRAARVDAGSLDDLSGLSLERIERELGSALKLAPSQPGHAGIERLEFLALALAADGRVGARRWAERLRRWIDSYRAEMERVAGLFEFEALLRPSGAVHVAGMDEAGRGPLAGPVVAAAVLLREGAIIAGLNDSKQVPEDVREDLFGVIVGASLRLGIGMADPGLIGRVNILRATHEAMRRAVAKLGESLDYVLVDGLAVPSLATPHLGVVGGDARCASIAAASIVAKVTRDRIMRRMAKRYPVYGFERNKGYPTSEHWQALRRYGPCPEHRLTFIGRRLGVCNGESCGVTPPDDDVRAVGSGSLPNEL
jgi:ribonuclease HII